RVVGGAEGVVGDVAVHGGDDLPRLRHAADGHVVGAAIAGRGHGRRGGGPGRAAAQVHVPGVIVAHRLAEDHGEMNGPGTGGVGRITCPRTELTVASMPTGVPARLPPVSCGWSSVRVISTSVLA